MKSPQMLAIADIHDVFLPQPEDLLVNLTDSYDLVISMLDNFESYFSPRSGHPKTQESCFLSALSTGHRICKHIGGKMMMFQVSHASSRHSLLQIPNTASNDLSAKFSASSPFFTNTALDYAHD